VTKGSLESKSFKLQFIEKVEQEIEFFFLPSFYHFFFLPGSEYYY